MVDFAVVPERTALLNIDMQNCFVENSPIAAPDGLTILPRINRLARACRAAGIQVIHASIVTRPDGSNLGVLRQFSPPAREGILNKGSFSAELHSGLEIDPRDILIDKPRFGAFYGTDLEIILRQRGIERLLRDDGARSGCSRFQGVFPERRHSHGGYEWRAGRGTAESDVRDAGISLRASAHRG